MNTEPETEAPARATRVQLQELHQQMAQLFLDYLTNLNGKKPNAGVIREARQFLKDNNIAKDLTQAGGVKAALADLGDVSIPFLPTFTQ